jgi:hypothetical protein
MKYLSSAALSLLLLVALASCYWMGDFNTGSVTMDFSQIQARASAETVRVYLLANGLLFSAGSGQPFAAEVPLGVDDRAVVKIDGLPVGPSYKALVGAGYTDQGVFYVDYYGESEEFSVSAGDDVTTTARLEYNVDYFYGLTYSTDLMGKNLVGVVAGNSNVYAAEANKVYEIDTTGKIQDSYDLANDPNLSSHIINSLSRDGSNYFGDALMNTNMGIVPFGNVEGWSFDPSFSSGLAGDRQIAESGDFDLGNDRAVFFRRSDGLGGRYIGVTTGSWRNINVDGVTDLTLSNTYAYFAAEGGAFALKWDFLSDPQPSFTDSRTDLSTPAQTLSLGYQTSGNILYMGTTDGVWAATIRSEPNDFASLSQIPETAGRAIEMIDISSYYPNLYQAFLSRYSLFIRRNGTIYIYPFFGVLPGKITGIAWSYDFDTRLYISGTEGLSVLYLGSG